MHSNTTDIRSAYAPGLRVAASRHDVDKRFCGIALGKQSLQIHRAISNRGVERGMDTTNHRRKVWHEGQPNGLTGSQR